MGSNTPCEYPQHCMCDTVRMRCENFIPRYVPDYVSEIILSLSLFNSTLLTPGIFCNVSWNGVTRLSIKDTGSQSFFFNNYIFICLKKIQVLKLYTTNSLNASKNVLYGLDSVKVLDLSGCDRLRTKDLVILLSGKTNVANLQKLFLTNTGNIYEGINISKDLIDALSDKDITEVDLSSTIISANNPILDGICDTLKMVNLSNSILAIDSYFLLNRTCRSLRILDLNALNDPHRTRKHHNVSCINKSLPVPTWLFDGFQFFQYLDIINLSRLTTDTDFLFFINCSVLGVNESVYVKEIHISGYNIPTLDMEVHKIQNKLQYIDLSNNKIETIGLNLLKRFQYLTKLDLSKNKLSQTNLFDRTFSLLFQNNSHLEDINLNDNGLSYLPASTFSSNIYLKRIDVSNNLFKQITFNVSRLINMNILDMQNNSIQYLDESSRRAVESLYKKHKRLKNLIKQNSSATFLIDLRSNPFSCECDSLQFVKWFVASPIFKATRHQYHCKSDGQEIEMNNKAIEAAEDDCERPKRTLRKILLSSVIPTAIATLLLMVFIYVVKRYRKKKFYQRLKDQVGLLHDDEIGFRFPVFMSFSSDDSEFVLPNVLSPLQVRDNVNINSVESSQVLRPLVQSNSPNRLI